MNRNYTKSKWDHYQQNQLWYKPSKNANTQKKNANTVHWLHHALAMEWGTTLATVTYFHRPLLIRTIDKDRTLTLAEVRNILQTYSGQICIINPVYTHSWNLGHNLYFNIVHTWEANFALRQNSMGHHKQCPTCNRLNIKFRHWLCLNIENKLKPNAEPRINSNHEHKLKLHLMKDLI